MRTWRAALLRELQLVDTVGERFRFALPDSILQAVDQISQQASGHPGVAEQVTNPSTRDRCLVDSLIEEAITSSQLEGAVTSHDVAAETARRDLRELEDRGFLHRRTVRRRHYWASVPDLVQVMQDV